VRKINNNAAICVDGKGRELVALGRGIGFGEMPHELELAQIDRTFYGVDARYLDLVGELPEDVLEFSGQLADVCRATLSYELSANLPITLADHIAFMVKRAREHMVVSMPLAYDVQQLHPVEYKLAEMAVRGARKTFKVRLDRHEATGIALSIVNSAITASERTQQRERRAAELLEQITHIVEDEMAIQVDRDSFDYARFATHVNYLLDRVMTGEPIETSNEALFEEVRTSYPAAHRCAERVSALVQDEFGVQLTREEQLYLMLHVNRITDRIANRAS
jgi:beta-glucoside operon transcriptional antiterminator